MSAWPCLRPGWVEAWWRAFGAGGGSLLIPALRRRGRLAAVVPLVRTGGRLRSPTNWHTARYGILATDPEAAGDLASWMLGRRVSSITLGFVHVGDPTVDAIVAAARRGGWSSSTRALPPSPHVEIEGSWEGWEGGLDAGMRRELRRRRRRLEELGSVAVRVHDGNEALDELLDEGFAVEGSGWKDREGTAIRSRPETERFYRDIARWAATRGWLRLAFVRLDTRPLAFDFSLELAGAHFLLKTGFDPAFARYGPGRLLRSEMLERSWAEGLSSYEFLGAPDPWKLEWTRTCRERVEVSAFAPTPAGAASRVLRTAILPAVRRARTVLRRGSA